MVIWKYPLELTDRQVIEMPYDSEIIHIGEQNGQLTLWALVDENEEQKEQRAVLVYGTGHPIIFGPAHRHVGTAQVGPFVWHVFVDGGR